MEVDGLLKLPGISNLKFRANGKGLSASVGRHMCSAVQGKLHRGWQLFEDNTLLLVLSETDNTRMTVEECMVSGSA